MAITADDLHRGMNFKMGVGPLGLSPNRCLVTLEEQNEDCDDDVISEEEDKRLMEGRNMRTNEEGNSGVNSARSSTSECWMNTYRKLRRASELIGASAVAIDNKIEMAMDLVKNHLMFAVREEMEQMREQIRGLTERNKQLEDENVILRTSTTSESLEKIFHSNEDANSRSNNAIEMTQQWLSNQDLQMNQSDSNDSIRKSATLIPLTPHFSGQMLASPSINMAGIQLSASPGGEFSTHLVRPFQFSNQGHFVSTYDPRVSSDGSAMGGNTQQQQQQPRFLIINPDIDPNNYNNITWTPTNNYNIILTSNNSTQQLPGHPN